MQLLNGKEKWFFEIIDAWNIKMVNVFSVRFSVWETHVEKVAENKNVKE